MRQNNFFSWSWVVFRTVWFVQFSAVPKQAKNFWSAVFGLVGPVPLSQTEPKAKWTKNRLIRTDFLKISTLCNTIFTYETFLWLNALLYVKNELCTLKYAHSTFDRIFQCTIFFYDFDFFPFIQPVLMLNQNQIEDFWSV